MLTALLVDDEYKSRATLGSLLAEYCPEVKITGAAGSIDEAVALILKEKPDVVFLDIEMNSETGFDLLEKTAHINFFVIFTTAYEQYALKAIKYSAADYLLKPIDIRELKMAVEKVKKAKASDQVIQVNELLKKLKETRSEKQQISISTATGLIFIKTTEIIWLEAEGAYTRFHLINQQIILSSKNIKEYEQMLPEDHFFRVHHSAIINTGEIVKYVRGAGGHVVMSDGSTVNVSRQRKEEFLQRINS